MPETISTIELPAEPQTPSARGMTEKVVRGSLWTLSGQILPLFAMFFATPFVIRLLGAESYGVFILVGLIPGYFNFADFGMSIGSTKFGSEAYAENSPEGEGKVVRTAALIAFLTSLPFAVGIFLSSFPIIVWLKIPEQMRLEAGFALKITAITFLLNILCSIFNTPQLARLRMDLNTFVNTGFRLLGIILVPIVLYLGGGIVGAVLVLMISALLTLFGHIFISGKLLNELFRFSISREIVKPLLRFGYPLVISGIAAILLVNLEKIVLTKAASVEVLAYYTVAFTFANMATLFSSSMIQSLIPAFSQLFKPEKKSELNKLFARSLKINIIFLIPLLMFLSVIAEPFFTVWAGAIYGLKSSPPFYILLCGLFFNVIAYVPHSVLMASGRTDIFAKIYWLELFPYIFLITILTYKFGAKGAALAWSLRVTADAFVIVLLSRKFAGVSLNIFGGKLYVIPILLLTAIVPILVVGLLGNYSLWLFPIVPLSSIIYFFVVWKKFLQTEEKIWLEKRFRTVFNAK